MHVRSGRRSARVHSHTCPIGLRCSCVPIHLEGHLVGVVKLVASTEVPRRDFFAATRLLSVVVSGVCQESTVSMLSAEVATLRRRVSDWRETEKNRTASGTRLDSTVDTPAVAERRGEAVGLVEGALTHLERQYPASDLSLLSVAEALGCNPRYLTTRFTLVVGERMHAYLVRLRVAHACRLLMETKTPIKEVAYSCGFRDNTGLARAFRRHVGVSPGEYRCIFAAR